MVAKTTCLGTLQMRGLTGFGSNGSDIMALVFLGVQVQSFCYMITRPMYNLLKYLEYVDPKQAEN